MNTPVVNASKPLRRVVAIRRASELPPAVRGWALDAPRHDAAVDVAAGTLYVQGWLLLSEAGEEPPRLLVCDPDAGDEPPQEHPFRSGRPDVVERVLGEPSAGHAQLRCGFALTLHLPRGGGTRTLEIGFLLPKGQVCWLAAIDLAPALQVIEGADGWLFLDNDTNRSVDQHTGRLKLGPEALESWRAYLSEVDSIARAASARWALVIAPAKERVLPELYPHARGAETPVDQVIGLARGRWPVLHLADSLARAPDPCACFMRTDTHWTDRGAMLGVLDALSALGLDAAEARRPFESDRYVVRRHEGDLGVKLLPPRAADTEFLDAPAVWADARFDNRLPNIGRVMVFGSDVPVWNASLLMFGASSGYQMLRYLKRLFRRVVFVHSAASVDPALVRRERPDFLLMQSNGRFVLHAPSPRFGTHEAVAEKLRAAPEDVRAHARRLVAQAEADSAMPERHYALMLREDGA